MATEPRQTGTTFFFSMTLRIIAVNNMVPTTKPIYSNDRMYARKKRSVSPIDFQLGFSPLSSWAAVLAERIS